MIARIWRGITSASKADEYLDCLNTNFVPDCQATTGNRGVWILRRLQGDQAHFLLLSLWESCEAIARSAGPNWERVSHCPQDQHFLLAFESLITHYEVLTLPEHAEPGPGPSIHAATHPGNGNLPLGSAATSSTGGTGLRP